MEGEYVADIAHHNWHLEVYIIKNAIDDAAIKEGRKWANKRCLLIDDTELEMQNDDKLRRATLPKRNITYKIVIRHKRRIGLPSMARPDGTWGVRGQWSSELSWLRSLGKKGQEDYRQQLQMEKTGSDRGIRLLGRRTRRWRTLAESPTRGLRQRTRRKPGKRQPCEQRKREEHGRRGAR